MTKVQAAQIYRLMVAAWPNARVTDATVEVYAMGMADIDFDTAKAAVQHLIMTAKWMPSISEVRDACVTVRAGSRRPAGDAWGDVMAAVRRWGVHRIPGVDFRFDDELVARAVKAIGWTTICNSEMIASERKQFIDLYQGYDARDRTDAMAQVNAGADAGRPSIANGRDGAHQIVSAVARSLSGPKR